MAHVESFAHVTTARVPADAWHEAWSAISAWLTFLHDVPGFVNLRAAAREMPEGDIRVQITTIWADPEQLEVFLQGRWTNQTLFEGLSLPVHELSDEVMDILI